MIKFQVYHFHRNDNTIFQIFVLNLLSVRFPVIRLIFVGVPDNCLLIMFV